jgi:hypothetical protein
MLSLFVFVMISVVTVVKFLKLVLQQDPQTSMNMKFHEYNDFGLKSFTDIKFELGVCI